MRCVTYNIQHGAQGLDKVSQVLEALAPDIIFLQEVDRGVERSGHIDQLHTLALHLGRMNSEFAEALTFEGGSYGLGLLSRRPLTDRRVIKLPHPSPRRDDGHGEPRLVLVARSGGLTLACTHLGLSEEERPGQALALRQALEGEPRLLVAGDMNEGPDGPVVGAWQGWLIDAYREAGAGEEPTAPPERPSLRIDQLLRSVKAPLPRAAFVGPAGASDHRPVIVDFFD